MTCRCTCTCKQPETDVFMEWAQKNGWQMSYVGWDPVLRFTRNGEDMSDSKEPVFVACESLKLFSSLRPTRWSAVYNFDREGAYVYSIELGALYELYKKGLKIYDIMKWDFKTGEE